MDLPDEGGGRKRGFSLPWRRSGKAGTTESLELGVPSSGSRLHLSCILSGREGSRTRQHKLRCVGSRREVFQKKAVLDLMHRLVRVERSGLLPAAAGTYAGHAGAAVGFKAWRAGEQESRVGGAQGRSPVGQDVDVALGGEPELEDLQQLLDVECRRCLFMTFVGAAGLKLVRLNTGWPLFELLLVSWMPVHPHRHARNAVPRWRLWSHLALKIGVALSTRFCSSMLGPFLTAHALLPLGGIKPKHSCAVSGDVRWRSKDGSRETCSSILDQSALTSHEGAQLQLVSGKHVEESEQLSKSATSIQKSLNAEADCLLSSSEPCDWNSVEKLSAVDTTESAASEHPTRVPEKILTVLTSIGEGFVDTHSLAQFVQTGTPEIGEISHVDMSEASLFGLSTGIQEEEDPCGDSNQTISGSSAPEVVLPAECRFEVSGIPLPADIQGDGLIITDKYVADVMTSERMSEMADGGNSVFQGELAENEWEIYPSVRPFTELLHLPSPLDGVSSVHDWKFLTPPELALCDMVVHGLHSTSLEAGASELDCTKCKTLVCANFSEKNSQSGDIATVEDLEPGFFLVNAKWDSAQSMDTEEFCDAVCQLEDIFVEEITDSQSDHVQTRSWDEADADAVFCDVEETVVGSGMEDDMAASHGREIQDASASLDVGQLDDILSRSELSTVEQINDLSVHNGRHCLSGSDPPFAELSFDVPEVTKTHTGLQQSKEDMDPVKICLPITGSEMDNGATGQSPSLDTIAEDRWSDLVRSEPFQPWQSGVGSASLTSSSSSSSLGFTDSEDELQQLGDTVLFTRVVEDHADKLFENSVPAAPSEGKNLVPVEHIDGESWASIADAEQSGKMIEKGSVVVGLNPPPTVSTSQPIVVDIENSEISEIADHVSGVRGQTAVDKQEQAEESKGPYSHGSHPTCVMMRSRRHLNGEQYWSLAELLAAPWGDLVFWHGHCQQGRPTLCVLLGRAVCTLSSSTLSSIVPVIVSHLELAELNLFGPSTEQMNLMLDLSGLGLLRMPPMDILQRLGTVINRDYAGRGGSVYVLNAPVMLSLVVAAIKGVILRPPYNRGAMIEKGFLESKESILILGRRFSHVLQKNFDISMLHPQFGGRCSCAKKIGACNVGYKFLLGR